ncbi:hypothetical protein, partial [Bacillus pumilus]|uniref:hypothetical protein n=1 Tax=Bacillus pumilus TaxID=1408 RepID=UPI002E1FF97C|nr:hypothetical protein [Bacillus pumilus]
PFVHGVPDNVSPLRPWHWLALLHQVFCPEEVTPSYSLTRSILPTQNLSLNRNKDTKTTLNAFIQSPSMNLFFI